MRRPLAILFVLLFSGLLTLPVLAASLQSSVPACCRKNGKHHCTMQAAGHADEVAVAVLHDKCPCFPNASVAAHDEIDTRRQAAAIFAGLINHPCGSPQTEAGYRLSFNRSRQKRGPPSPVLS